MESLRWKASRPRASVHSRTYYLPETRFKIWTALVETKSLHSHVIWKTGTKKKTSRFCTFCSTFPLLALSLFFFPLRFFPSGEVSLPSLYTIHEIWGFTISRPSFGDDWAEMAGAVGRKGEFGVDGTIMCRINRSPHFHAHQDRVPSSAGYEPIFFTVCNVYVRGVCCLRTMNESHL